MKTEHSRTKAKNIRNIASEPDIRKSLLMAHHLKLLLNQGRITDLNQASQWLGLSQSRLSHVLGLLFLSPAIQTEIMTQGLQSLASIPEYKMRDLSSEVDWDKQGLIWRTITQSTE